LTADVSYDKLVEEGFNLLKTAYVTRINDLSSSIRLATEALNIGEKIENPGLIAQAKNELGLFNMILGRFEQAKKFSQDALAHFETAQDIKGVADAKYTIAGVYYKTDNFHLGLECLLDCLHIYRKLNDPYNEARVLKSMGTIYEYFGDQENAIRAYLRSIEAGRIANDPNLESNAYNPLSGIYLKRGMHELALTTIEKSISIKERTQDVRGLAFALYGRGKINIRQKKFSEALADLSRCLQIQTQMGDQLGVAMAYNKLGVLHYETGKFSEARDFLTKAIQTSDEFNIAFIRYKSRYNMHLIARGENKLEEALQFLSQYIGIKEATINTHTYNVIKSYESISRIRSLEYEAEVQRSKTEIIEKKNAELDSFFYRVSHDLKGPISSLLGLHNLVKLEIKDPNARSYFEMYQSQIMRINNIVMDLINITRMNHTASKLVRIDFELLLKDCLGAYNYLPNFSSIEFIGQIEKNIEFYSEWAVVNTILQNLIENAIKYSCPDRKSFVRIGIRQEDAHVSIEVEDNGIGIAPDYQERIFDMFFRANDRVDGTGLGLYILKRAVERLKGEVKFNSELYKGSTFTVLLPLTYEKLAKSSP
jgi:signal transduction histidine kinase